MIPRLTELAERHPQIGDVRGRGAMLAIEIVEPGTRTADAAEAGRISVGLPPARRADPHLRDLRQRAALPAAAGHPGRAARGGPGRPRRGARRHEPAGRARLGAVVAPGLARRSSGAGRRRAVGVRGASAALTATALQVGSVTLKPCQVEATPAWCGSVRGAARPHRPDARARSRSASAGSRRAARPPARSRRSRAARATPRPARPPTTWTCSARCGRAGTCS